MKLELNLELKSSVLHVIAGVIVGFLSGYFSKDPYQLSNGAILSFTIIILLILWQTTNFVFRLKSISTEQKKYNFKWYLSNGVYPYVIFWLLVWILVYNIKF